MQQIKPDSLDWIGRGQGRIGNLVHQYIRKHSDDHLSFTKGRDEWNYYMTMLISTPREWPDFQWEYACDDGYIIQVTCLNAKTFQILAGTPVISGEWPEVEALEAMLEALSDRKI